MSYLRRLTGHWTVVTTIAVSVALPLTSFTTAIMAEETTDALKESFLRPDYILFPESAPYTPQIATLGKMLFFDTRLSKAQNMSCSSCHNPSFGWETPVDKSIGTMNVALKRHTPTLINQSDADSFFWDGRSDSLEDQARGPITNPLEMGMPMQELIERLNSISVYRSWFDELFPGSGITETSILASIATFERTLVSGWAPFDDWIAGDEDAISDGAKRGFELFNGRAGCAACHTGWAFTDREFHDIGLNTNDIGRYAFDPDNPLNKYAFKTPTLRNIYLRAPYMHNGDLRTLQAVLEHYASGGIKRSSRSPMIKPMQLTHENHSDLIQFLQTLTEKSLDVSTPVLPAE